MNKNIFALLILITVGVLSSNAQNTMNNSNSKPVNPLICDPEEGVCEVPTVNSTQENAVFSKGKKPIRVIYFTDPICSSCWGIEPMLRRLKLEYGDYIHIEYYMGGLLPDWSYNSGGISKPSDVAHHWDEVSAYYEMPIDGDVWLEDPLHSSYPPSIAFKAAQMQDEQKAITFLRVIREMVFLEKKNITKWEYLSKAALLSGLDTIRFKYDYENDAKKSFEADLAFAHSLGVRGFPTLFFIDDAENQVKVYGVKPYKVFENAILKLKNDATKKNYNATDLALFSTYNSLTVKEYAVLKEISVELAEKELDAFCQNRQLTRNITKNGNIYRLR